MIVFVRAIVLLILFHTVSHCSLESDIIKFKEWIASFPDADHINIEPHWFGEQLGIGAIATRDLNFGDIYASLPPSAIISEATARENKELASMCDDIYVMDVRQASMDCLILFMALEKRAGDASFWSPYIKLLPQNYDHLPTLFDDSDLAELQASYHRMIIGRAQRIFTAKFAEFTRLQQKYPHIFQPPMTYDEFTWALGVVTTRTIWYIEPGSTQYTNHLVPLVDLVNCAQLKRLDAVHKTYIEGNKVVTRVKQEFAAGEQVFENYGQTNSHYFTMHGFSIEPNEYDCVSIPMGESELCVNLHRLEGILEKYSGEGSAEQEMIELINEHLGKYETTLEQDEAILAGLIADEVHTRRKKASVQFRMSEKRLMASVLKKLYELVNKQHSEL